MKSCKKPKGVLVDVARLAPMRIQYRVTGNYYDHTTSERFEKVCRKVAICHFKQAKLFENFTFAVTI